MEKLSAFFKQLADFWRSLSTPKRLALSFVTMTVLLSVLLVAWLGSRIDYAYLYTNLETKDAAAIAQKLNEMQVPYEVDPSGTALRVPRDRVHALRLEMASSGLPSGGSVGNELFDQARLGATEFEQQVNLRRALEGELARSIMTIQGVEHARVHLVLPKNRLFAAKSEGASASVIVRLKNRDAFGREEVAGVVHLVATAVPNLTHDRVSVVDSNGVTLHSPDQGGFGGALGAADNARGTEAAIEQRVRSLLERTTGPGAVDVRVKLDLNSSTRERTEEHYEPTSTALRSEHETEELSGTENATVAGVPGAQTNLPDVEPTVAGRADGAGGNILQRSHTRNWEIDRVVEKILTPAGELRRVSVAVLVDGRYEQKEGQRIFVPRSLEELKALEQVVQGAVGFDPARGDRIELHAVRFARPDIEESPVAPPAPVWRKYLPHAVGAAGLLLALAMFVLLRRSKQRQVKALALERARPMPELGRPAATAEARLIEAEEREAEAALLQQRRQEALLLAASDPASAALVLREWLSTSDPVTGASQANG